MKMESPQKVCNKELLLSLTLRISLEMYAIQSSFKLLPLVFLTRSVIEPAPQNSMTNCTDRKIKGEKTT